MTYSAIHLLCHKPSYLKTCDRVDEYRCIKTSRAIPGKSVKETSQCHAEWKWRMLGMKASIHPAERRVVGLTFWILQYVTLTSMELFFRGRDISQFFLHLVTVIYSYIVSCMKGRSDIITVAPACKVSVLSNENWPYKRADLTSIHLFWRKTAVLASFWAKTAKPN